jgi:hypothetical protein
VGTRLRSGMRRRFDDEAGVSLVEVLVAVFLLLGTFTALAQVATTGLWALRATADRTTAIGLATQAVEAGRSVPWEQLVLDEDEFSALCGELVPIDEAGTIEEEVLCGPDGGVADGAPFWGPNGLYELETYVTAIPGFDNARRITAEVTWEERGRERTVRTSNVVAQVDRG